MVEHAGTIIARVGPRKAPMFTARGSSVQHRDWTGLFSRARHPWLGLPAAQARTEVMDYPDYP